ncbi:MAG: 30S ribosomal protein S13 [Halobacteriales archaeon]|nr:30S ribosomal protein S13 [Halobacteriales archaeon]
MADKKEFGPEFRHLVRLVNTDLDGKKNVGTALAYVPGVGKRLAFVVAREANVDPTVLIGNLKDPEIAAVNKAIEELTETLPTWMLNRRKDPESGDDRHMIGTEITIMLREDLNRLKKIRSWRGHRHERKLPTRGQRTKANGRFGSAVGVQRKTEGGAAAPPAATNAPAAAGAAKPAAKAPSAAAGAAAKTAAKPAAPAGGKK